MKSKNKNRISIFPENMLISEKLRDFDLLNEIELLDTKPVDTRSHALSKEDIYKEQNNRTKNDITDLIKAGCRLPEVDTPEKMLLRDKNGAENKPQNENGNENSPYRMVNLISKNFRLPDIEDENFLR